MVPFHANDQEGASLQFDEPQWEGSSSSSSPWNPEKSRLDDTTLDFSPTYYFPTDPSSYDKLDCGLLLTEHTSSHYSQALDDCERGCASAVASSLLPISLPLYYSLSADKQQDSEDGQSQSLILSQKRSNKVTFSKHVECYEIDALDSYSNEEYDASWYTQDELLSMRHAAYCIRRQEAEDESIFSFRGFLLGLIGVELLMLFLSLLPPAAS